MIIEDLAPYGGQTSSSCGGLVAFGHQMGALLAPLDKYKYIYAQLQMYKYTNAKIQKHIGFKYKYNNQGQIHYGVVVVRNIFRLGPQGPHLGAQRAPIWWPKATSPPQELEVWPP